MYRIIVASFDNFISKELKRAIYQFTGDNNNCSAKQRQLIEEFIVDSEPLDSDLEYKRGIFLNLSEFETLLNVGYYKPGQLTSWTVDEGRAQMYAIDKAEIANKIPIVLCYRGSKWLNYGIYVAEYSQYPDEDEEIFSSKIKMKIAQDEIDGFDFDTNELISEVVYINLYD